MDTINLFTEPISVIAHALWMAFNMFWEILWALILGFTLSGIIQAVVSKSEMVRLMPNDTTGLIARACGLGAASSSCSYAAVAIARSII
ncbi:permease [Nostoc sp.]|uniref:permease n=1 Tax=Nostoc sp. TaxID=1180 RepID=UPI002FF805B6